MIRRVAMVAAVIVLGASSAHAQSEAQVWSSVGVERSPNRRVTVGVEQHLRFDDDSSRVGAVLSDAKVDFKLRKWLRLATGYRFAYTRNGKGELVYRHRVHGDVQLRRRLGVLRLSLRTRWQETLRGATAADGIRHKWRNRIKLRWRASTRVRPFASTEVFHAVGNGSGIVFDTLRFTVGSSYRFELSEVAAFYRIEQPRDAPMDPTLHIVGVALNTNW